VESFNVLVFPQKPCTSVLKQRIRYSWVWIDRRSEASTQRRR